MKITGAIFLIIGIYFIFQTLTMFQFTGPETNKYINDTWTLTPILAFFFFPSGLVLLYTGVFHKK